MTKQGLVNQIAQRSGLSKKRANQALNIMIEVMGDALGIGEDLYLPGYGIFSVIDVDERLGYNPQTKELIIIPAHKRVTFRAGIKMKRALYAPTEGKEEM
uniref:Histone family protein DNA-binding protein n=1 Tax=Magnetococcus massalia (strain MO-1) TaxID=451514 RepID=A0A1S7LHX7_MAGMO|nr:Histone family protein DNA-binding protein [Candidatus Magnetococcus massalia]CRH06003.1 Histone family protein DNA-binding protein [Candidatus Magnetococcus massalia]